MILVDANLLIYAYDRSSPFHEPARRWLMSVLSGSEPVAFSWNNVLAFLRISTSRRIFGEPLSIEEAIAIVDDWLRQPVVQLLQPGERHWEILRSVLLESNAKGKLVMDAHLASLALEHEITLFSRDSDFALFHGLHSVDPLVEPEQ